jgi:hypothetical protein
MVVKLSSTRVYIHERRTITNMYSVICTFQQTIISSISPQEVTNYDRLRQNVGQANTAAYQQLYRDFWGMNVAQLSIGFYTTYFEFLKATTTPTLANLCQALYDSSARRDGTRTLQFSFATKLLHTLNPHLPIFDSKVARFYLFEPPSSDRPAPERIGKLTVFHGFLKAEYERVINSSQLATAIDAFHQRFNPQQHTDEKIVDWLIWKLVNLADGGALLNGQIVYS